MVVVEAVAGILDSVAGRRMHKFAVRRILVPRFPVLASFLLLCKELMQ